MGRHEQPVPPGVLHDFATGLRTLRAAAGSPAYREMSRIARYSSSALSAAAAGQSLPTLELTLAYVKACGGDADEWRERWQTAAAVVRPPLSEAPTPGSAAPPDAPASAPIADDSQPTEPSSRRRRTIVKIGAGPLIVALALVLFLIFNNKPTTIHTTLQGGNSPVTTAAPPTTIAAAPSVADIVTSSVASTAATNQGTGTLTYDRTQGPGCAEQSDGAVFEDEPEPTHLWTDATATSWPEGPCPDTVLTSTPTTKSDGDVWENDYGWNFSGLPNNAVCTYDIYIPDTPDSQYSSVLYFWTTGDGQYTDQRAFFVDQGANRGTWVKHGPFTFTTGLATLEVTDSRANVPNAPLTASLVRLSCTS